MPGLDEMLLAADDRPELHEAPLTIQHVEQIARSDLSRTWTLNEVAKRLCMSARSLQRALASEDAKFSEVLDCIRTNEARRLLERSKLSVTEIGYLGGFADSSHFNRR